MDKEIEEELNNIRSLIHRQLQQIETTKKAWEPGTDSEDDLDRLSSKTFLFVFQIMQDVYMRLEAMYIANLGWAEQIDLLKDAIFELKEVNNDSSFKERINKIFSTSKEMFEEQGKSFMKSYDIDESSK